MPRYSAHQLKWSEDTQSYEFFIDGQLCSSAHGTDWWEKIAAFSFRGRSGDYCTVRKETKQRGDAYWYGYRRQAGRLVKRYIGKTVDLSLAHLESIAKSLANDKLPSPTLPDIASNGRAKAQGNADDKSTPGLLASRQDHLPLLATKLSPPRLPSLLVERSRLLIQLDAALAHKLTLLQAPAGFGKTTIVAQWINQHSADSTCPAVAWVSLDAGDNDLVRFLRYLIAAFQSVRDDLGQAALIRLSAALYPPFESPSMETILTLLLNDLAKLEQSGLLVLDDYHTITEPSLHEMLTFFCDHLPPTWRVLLMTRSEPPLPLPRWRVRGELAEVHTADLRFLPEETAVFLNKAGQPTMLSNEALSRLEGTLGGWAAGLRMLILALQGQRTWHEVEKALVSLNGQARSAFPFRPLLNYFVTEILDAQAETLQRFLLQTSMLSRLTGSLCEAVTGREDSATLLETVERAGLFLEAQDEIGGREPEYRYHPLFAEALRIEARHRLGEAALRALSLQASRWYEQHALPAEAVDTALLAHDMERTVYLIERLDATKQLPEPQTLCRWLEQVPDTLLYAHPQLCFSYATALQFSQGAPVSETKKAYIDTLLGKAEEAWHNQGEQTWPGVIAAFRALRDLAPTTFPSAIEHARQALALLPEQEKDIRIQGWRSASLSLAGIGCMQEGYFSAAQPMHREAYAYALSVNNRQFACEMLLLLGWNSFMLGELHLAHEYYHQALFNAREQEAPQDIASALFGQTCISFEWNDLAATEQQLQEASTLLDEKENGWSEHAALYFALLHHAQGQISSAQQQLVALLARLQASSAPLWLHPFDILGWQIRHLLATGDLQSAQLTMESLTPYEHEFSFIQHIEAAILQARLQLAQGQAHTALHQLENILPIVQEQQLLRHVIEVQVLYALAYAANNQKEQARRRLHVTLSQAYHEGFIRLFLAEGEPLVRLLRATIPTIQEKRLRSYARAILRAFTTATADKEASVSKSSVFEPLSAQEQRVLGLLAAGYTNPEIARELVVSVNTVKDHVKHLYQKLGVSNRLQASEVARRLQLY
ncbi:hypothetical protein EPA93_03535 [Ktedonosporobacter rubrisoli]|uniref:HTH luxR-type domain-containing protein n=1 Tax=Ktedonosporobacter rubrisoli TaxID=2509675 RepID=A0A4P6JKE7_KTERU|nr:LuxR C-terminal-related transcriptional regulator [Ktedonosporobacter rubrisoli]QBD75116.1 hypothetical protein EPA93_03535 [Ktedonosporobacter rubrisoli]